LFAEREFLLRIDGFAVRGRIDAIYGEPEGPWDVVDWKTGRSTADPLQLEVYGLACVEIWGKRPEDLSLTYCYLDRGEIASVPMGDPAEIRARLAGQISEIDAGAFEPTPGPACGYCDFRRFCEPGTAWLANRQG
jgi:DNA helicase-2/ATP-dependent DNA helicase PcrA